MEEIIQSLLISINKKRKKNALFFSFKHVYLYLQNTKYIYIFNLNLKVFLFVGVFKDGTGTKIGCLVSHPIPERVHLGWLGLWF